MKKIYLLSMVTVMSLYAQNMGSFTSMQGYSGFINIPTANVLDYGDVEFSFSNQVSISKKVDPDKRDTLNADDYLLNIGFFPYLELGGRLSNITYKDPSSHSYPFLTRDLSTNIKFRLPTEKFLPITFPKFAVGLQDFGGETSEYKSKYLVTSGDIYSLEYALGYGFDSLRLDGVFGGLSYHVNDYLSLIGEYDTKEKHLGVRVNSGDYFKDDRFSLLVKQNLDYKDKPISVALSYKTNLQNSSSHKKEPVVYKPMILDPIEDIKNELVEVGFENIDIGERDSKIFIGYENSVYNRNELDAIAKILDIISKYKKYKSFNIVIKKSNVKIKSISGCLTCYRDNLLLFKSLLVIDTRFPTDKIYRYKNINSSYRKARLELSPKLKTFVATEVGVLDYQLSLQSNLSWNFYKGFDFNIVYLSPLLHSNDLDPDTGAFKDSYEGARVERVMLHHSFSYDDFFNTLSVGLYKKDYRGFINESSYRFDSNTIKYKFGYFKHKDFDINSDDRKFQIVTMEHYFENNDFIVSLSKGKYWAEDEGYEFKIKKFFDDTMIYLLFQKSNNLNNKFVGIGFEVPLTPRKIPNNKYLQITSTNAFNHKIKTTISKDENVIASGQFNDVKTSYDISNHFYNRDRLNSGYIKKSLIKIISRNR